MNYGQRIFWLWRLLASAFSYTAFGLGGVVVPVIVVPILYLLPGGAHARQQRARKVVRWLFFIFIHLMRLLRILSWQISGVEKLQRKGLLILANHPTLLDVVFLIAFIPDATCIVKRHLLRNPAMRGFITLTGYITNDNGNRLIVRSSSALAHGSNLIVFPEGTRSRLGEPPQLQRGAANIAVRCETDITPVVIHCSPATLSKEHKWYHIPDKPFVMTFSVLEDLSITPFTDGQATLNSRKLTRRLESVFTQENELYA